MRVWGQSLHVNIRNGESTKPMIQATACALSFLCCVLCAAEEQWAVAMHGRDGQFKNTKS